MEKKNFSRTSRTHLEFSPRKIFFWKISTKKIIKLCHFSTDLSKLGLIWKIKPVSRYIRHRFLNFRFMDFSRLFSSKMLAFWTKTGAKNPKSGISKICSKYIYSRGHFFIWDRICPNRLKNGGVIQFFSSNSGQKFQVRAGGPEKFFCPKNWKIFV